MNPYDPLIKILLAAAGIKPNEAKKEEKKEKEAKWKPAEPDLQNQFQQPHQSAGQRKIKDWW